MFINPVVVKDKVLPFHPIKKYKGSRNISPLIYDLGARRRLVFNIRLRPLYSRQITPIPTE
jgi:hypothetical protein